MQRPNRKRKAAVSSSAHAPSLSSVPNYTGFQTSNHYVRRASILRSATRIPESINEVLLSDVDTNFLSSSSSSSLLISPLYLDLGDCTHVYEFCGALFWFAERLLASPLNRRPRYTICCRAGKVNLDFPIEPPDVLKNLFLNSHFLMNIRAYNSMFSMTSFGANVDETVNRRVGTYVFKVLGQISHWLGSLCPPPGQAPRFLQMYIFDGENEVSNRMRFFGGGDQTHLSPKVVSVLTSMLSTVNEYVKLFRCAKDLCLQTEVPDFHIRLHSRVKQKNYDNPSPGTLGAIVGDVGSAATDFDVIIRSKDETPQRVSKLHPSYMPMQYPLLFPYAEQGWSPDLRLTSSSQSRDHNLSMNMFYSYQIHDRANTYTHILKAGRLFQQYLVDAYVCVEQCRLDYIRANQNMFRTEFLHGIHDALTRGDTEGRDIGKRTILPASFTGGPRYMYKHYQDALAICRVHGNPQYFITFTFNVKWPKIKREISRIGTVKAQDRPDIIARVFQMKVDTFISFLKSKKPFGEVTADLYTIEFQKRGLPHCHTLLWVTSSNKIHNPDDVDQFITAELPDASTDPILHRIVTDCMMHGPCGLPKMNAPCMVDSICSKSFPKPYEVATRFDKQGYIHYKRSNDGRQIIKGGIALDNGYVVPYNKTLCMHFDAHINVEYCGWNMLIKYLFKYISKGVDQVRFAVTGMPESSSSIQAELIQQVNEINNYVDGRFVCPHEAAWRILNFPIHNRNPPVQVLAVHLEGMQNVTFRETQHLHNIVSNPGTGKTTLTEWLNNNQCDPEGRDLRYIDYLSRYRWDCNGKVWIRRVSNRTPSIGRLAYIHPSCGETFYLRILLTYQTGCRTFADLRSVAGVILLTYRVACEKLGLVGDDNEWSATFTEAAQWATASELRSLFAHILLFCEVSNPLAFWQAHWSKMGDDIILKINQATTSSATHVNGVDLQQHILYEIEVLLKSSARSCSLADFGLPLPNDSLLSVLRNRLLMEETCYDRDKLATEHLTMRSCLRTEQLSAYNMVMTSHSSSTQILLFIYGHGGTGNTFLWTTIISALRSVGKIVLAVAASGIASLLLPAGRTAHSRFKIPLSLTDESTCFIKKNTQLAQLLMETSLIIWDEAPMNDRKCFESLDRSLRDITGNESEPFGGKSVLLGGDFRQTLPIEPKASKSKIIASSLPRSYLWSQFKIHRLNENVRVMQLGATSAKKQDIENFSRWLLDIGDGKLGVPINQDLNDVKMLEIQPRFLIKPSEDSLLELISFIYDDSILQNPSAENPSDKAIVCPKNETVNEINELVLSMSPGDCLSYLSTESMVPLASNGNVTDIMYPVEYLNLLNFSGIPSHCLKLKKILR